MKDKRISDLTPLEKPTGNEEFPVAIDGQNYKVKIKDVKPDMSDYITSKQASQKYYPKVDGDSLSDLVDTLNEGLGYVEKDLEDNYARKDGAYEGMLVGSAMNLQGQDVSVNNSMYRTAGGSSDIASGLAEVVSVQGNAVAWNQLAKNEFSPYSNTYLSDLGNGKYEIIANAGSVENAAYIYGLRGNKITLIENHVYLSCFSLKPSRDCDYTFTLEGRIKNNYTYKAGVWTTAFQFQKAITSKEVYLYIANQKPSIVEIGDTFEFKNPLVFDLTLIYGAGNEPTTPEQFEADYQRWFGKTLEYEEYDEGSIRTVLATGIKTVGFNLYSGGDYEGNNSTWYQKNTRTLWKNDCGYTGQIHINCDFIRKSGTGTVFAQIFYKDGDNIYVRFSGSTINGVIPFVTKKGGIVTKIIASYDTDWEGTIKNLCINFVWSGKRNGEYEPHWEETKALPITSLTSNGEVIFPDGLKRAGDVYDEIFVENGVTKAVKRVGSVDLGTLSYTKDNYSRFLGKISKSKKDRTLGSLCYNFTLGEAATLKEKEYAFNDLNIIFFKDSTFVDDTDAFKSSMDGVILYYELAEPITYTIDNFNLPLAYRVDDFGTEQILSPENSVTPLLLTKYGINAVDTLRRLPTEYISVNSLLELLAQLTAAYGGTWNMTWSESKQCYTFSHTASASQAEALQENVEELK